MARGGSLDLANRCPLLALGGSVKRGGGGPSQRWLLLEDIGLFSLLLGLGDEDGACIFRRGDFLGSDHWHVYVER